MTESDFLETIRTIDTVRLLDKKFQVSGSRVYKYQFAGPLEEEAVREFEIRNNIHLPEDYRLFMTRLGPGAGPDTGVYGPIERNGIDLSLPFPFEQTMTYAGNPELQTWEDGLTVYPGMLAIGYPGGTEKTELVISGKASGTIWHIEERGYFPSKQTFGEWYLEWLQWIKDTSIPALLRDQVSNQIHTGMTRAEVMALCSTIGEEWHETAFREKTYDLEFANLLTKFRMTRDNIVQSTIPRHLSYKLEEKEKLFSTEVGQT